MNGHDDETLRFNRRRALQILGAGVGAATRRPRVDRLGGPRRGRPELQEQGPGGPGGDADAPHAPVHREVEQPGKKCSNCAQFEAGKYKECGGCKLFAGAVNPEGYCLSWAVKAKKTT